MRAADVAAGGEGAPLVPVYHRALVDSAGLAGTVVVVNIGGVANITRIGADGTLLAGDTGPGNALLDDFVHARTGAAMDTGGALAARGRVNRAALKRLMADRWFDRPLPKSLDRDAFSTAPVAGLSDADGAATLTAFTSRTILKGIVMAGGAERIVVSGGGVEQSGAHGHARRPGRRAGRRRRQARLVARFHRGGSLRLSRRPQPQGPAADLPRHHRRQGADDRRAACRTLTTRLAGRLIVR